MTHDRAWTPLAHDKHDRARTAAGETEVAGRRRHGRERSGSVFGRRIVRSMVYALLFTEARGVHWRLCTGVAMRTSVVSHRGHGSRDTARVTRSVEGIHFPVPCSVPG